MTIRPTVTDSTLRAILRKQRADRPKEAQAVAEKIARGTFAGQLRGYTNPGTPAYTAGPLTVERYGRGSLVLAGCRIIADCKALCGAELTEADGNARLYAAAPQLAEQLNAFVEFANQWFADGMPEDFKGRCACANKALSDAGFVA